MSDCKDGSTRRSSKGGVYEMPKTSSGGQFFGLEDIKKNRGREGKLRQKKADKTKKKKLGNMKTPTFLVGAFHG